MTYKAEFDPKTGTAHLTVVADNFTLPEGAYIEPYIPPESIDLTEFLSRLETLEREVRTLKDQMRVSASFIKNGY